MTKKLFVVTVLGKDREGLVAGITNLLAEYGVNIVDIEQSVIHSLFSMFMLIDVSYAKVNIKKIRSGLAKYAKKQHITVKIIPYSLYSDNEDKKQKNIQRITIFGKDKPGIVAAVSKALYGIGLNIERIKMIARGDLFAMEMLVDLKKTPQSQLKETMKKVAEEVCVDIIIQPEDIMRQRRRLVVFDMDGTIVDAEIIDELAKAAGVGKKVSELTAKGLRGEIDFKESLRQRVKLLAGLPETALRKIRDDMKLTPGSEELITTLKEMGCVVALISGGFTYFTDALKERLGFDYAYGNELVIRDGKLTGEIRGKIIDSKRKAEIMAALARRERIPKEDIVAVGDGANDRIMLQNAGLGIAFNAKEVLKKVADGSITKENLKGLMYCLGASRVSSKNKSCSA